MSHLSVDTTFAIFQMLLGHGAFPFRAAVHVTEHLGVFLSYTMVVLMGFSFDQGKMTGDLVHSGLWLLLFGKVSSYTCPAWIFRVCAHCRQPGIKNDFFCYSV